MSKKFKSQASSARAASSAFGSSAFGFGNTSGAFQTSPSSLSYITELPDLSSISDQQVVVSLRNLGKKDSTTKGKALEELQEHVNSAAASVEAGVLDAWVQLYPRTAIDNSRRVRQLAHTLQGSITVSVGKRIAPLLPKVIGPWLCGLYDGDKSVSRAAQDAVEGAFNTEDKRKALWKVYQDSLLEYANDAILVQTANTLSDERSTTPDEAEAKHVRVVGSAMVMFGRLIQSNSNTSGKSNLQDNELALKLIKSKKLWELAHHKDPYLRRGVYSLATLCVNAFSSDIDWSTMSTSFISKALHTSQLGSSQQFTEALITLTRIRPQIWTTDYSSKTLASKRLSQFLSRGSQRGTEKYWSDVNELLKIVPNEAWRTGNGHDQKGTEDENKLIEAIRSGMTSSEEPRQNLNVAWAMYIDLTSWLTTQISDIAAQELFLEEHLVPLIIQYVVSAPSQSVWSLPTKSALPLTVVAVTKLARHPSLVEKVLSDICQQIIQQMKLSLPETAKDFASSQNSVIAMSTRSQKLRSALKTDNVSLSNTSDGNPMHYYDRELIKASIELLKNRNGKPYCAAAVLNDVISQADFDSNDPELTTFLHQDLPNLLQSPSAEFLVTTLRLIGQPITETLDSLFNSQQSSTYGEKALVSLISTMTPSELESNERVAKQILAAAGNLAEDSKHKPLVHAALHNEKLASSSFQSQLLAQIASQLSSDNSSDQIASMDFIDTTLNDSGSRSKISNNNALFLSQLLHIAESPDTVKAEKASRLTIKLRSLQSGESPTSLSNPTLRIIKNQLSGTERPISILSLIDLASETYVGASGKTEAVGAILPSAEDWQAALQPHLHSPRPFSLTITSPLQGAIYKIETPDQSSEIARDADDFSLAFRLGFYLTRLLSLHDIHSHLTSSDLEVLIHYFPLVLQIVNEKLTLDTANNIWIDSTPEVLDEAADVLSIGNNFVQTWIENSDTSIATHWTAQLPHLLSNNSNAYYLGLTFWDIQSRVIDSNGPGSILTELETDLKKLHRSEHLLQAATIASTFRDYVLTMNQGRRLLNELIADATELKSMELTVKNLRPLMLLNIFLSGSSDSLEDIPNQRLVFLMQNLVRLLNDVQDGPMLSEVLKLLSSVLPALGEIYGDHWQQVLQSIIDIWARGNDLGNDLPLLHSSLRLYQKLKTLATSEDVNEDLVDSFTSSKPNLENGLLQCLQFFENPADGINQPRRITAELLGRLLVNVKLQDETTIYPLLSSHEDAVQKVSYTLLHHAIPARQEQLSLDLALEKKTAHLRPELMSAIEDVPTDPASSKNYLLCWQLIFDHFPTASYKLREEYTADVKSSNHLPVLLTFICNSIRITSGRPIEASKFDIKDFELGISDSDLKEAQWLSVHLYYCCLLYLPSLTKTWFIEQKNRVKSPLEAWTQKYISPSIISASLITVTDWADTQDSDDAPVTVKSSPKGSEIVGSIAIDPESPPIAIAINLPGSYPLESPTVIGRTRVGVSDKNWQSWLRTFQIIIFSTGSIIEGLIAFRRNVQGALKGQSECAICYSIIGTDMQTPNKRCGTCKNTFHGSCLFRWFKSSNSSSCPLCRNNFNYA